MTYSPAIRFSLGLVLAVALSLTAAPVGAQCGGLCVYEVGTMDMGASGAGAGARAQGPGTVLFNPAGMSRLEDTQIHVGMVNLISIDSFEFNASPRTQPNPPGSLPPFAGTSGGGDLGTYVPYAGAYASHEISDRFHIGFAFAGMYAGEANYAKDWAGRTLVTDVSLVSFGLQPALSFRVTDWFSIGGSVSAVYTTFDIAFATSLALQAPTVQIKNAEDWGVQGSVGLLFEPSENTRIGITYRSKVDLKLNGEFINPSPMNLNFDINMTFPQGFNISVFHQLTNKVALLADGGWSDWSVFGYQPATLGPATIPINRDWRDTWRLAIGVHFMATEKLLLTSGFSYDSSPVTSSLRLPDIPVSEAYRFSAGMKLPVAVNIDLGLTYTFMWMGNNVNIDQVALPPTGTTILDGRYDPAWIHFVGIQIDLRFGGPYKS